MPAEAVIVFLIAVYCAAVVYPATRICRRIGLSPILGALAIVPLANIVLLWFVAVTP